MKYGSVCSGIEAATMGWEHMGWEAQWFSEIENFPSAVLAHHYPNVPNLGDMTKLNQNPIFNESTIDVLVGGTPCQSFSVAGLRKGLEDPRGNLALEFCRLAYLKKPKWIVWENVPGVLSSNGGKDFGSFLGALGELGYGFAYRVLDAQHFGVPQRRRRVFLVGYLGDWRPAAAVLFESESLRGDTKKGVSKRKTTTEQTEAGPNVCDSGTWRDGGQTAASLTTRCHDQYMPDKGHFSAVIQGDDPVINQSPTITTSKGSRGGCSLEAIDEIKAVFYNSENKPLCFKVRGGVERETGEQGGTPGKLAGKGYLGSEDKTFTIATSPDQWLLEGKQKNVGALCARDYKGVGSQYVSEGKCIVEGLAVDMYNMSINNQTSQTLSSSASDINHTGGTIQNSRVRRLTPVECERLQGFPDNFTQIPYRNKPQEDCPDGPRYKALGNSMAVPVMRWIGERINDVNNILNETR